MLLAFKTIIQYTAYPVQMWYFYFCLLKSARTANMIIW